MNSRNLTDSLEEEGDYLINPSDVIIGKSVGQGQFGSVYIGKYFGDFVAVKKQVYEAKGLQAYLQREINVLKRVQHDHIMSYYGAYDVLHDCGIERSLFIVSEFCQGGDLLDLLLDQDEALGWKFRINVAFQAASAIDYMHQNNIIHRDIKSSNILLNQEWQCKLCDFGLAREVDPDTSDRMTLCGTNEYMAPELLFDEGNYSFEIDVFSFGMVLLEIMMRGKVGFNGFAERSPRSKFELDVASVRSMIPRDAPESLLSLAFQCVDDEASNRPTGTDVADWLQDLLGDLPSDTCPLPKMRHSESLLNSIEMQFEAEVSVSTILEPIEAVVPVPLIEKFTTPTKAKPVQRQSADQPFLEYTARQIILATKYTISPKPELPKKSIRSPKNDGSDSTATPPSTSTSTSRNKRKPISADDMSRIGSERSTSSKDLTPNSKAINNTSTSAAFVAAGFGKGRISFGTTNAKERRESIQNAKERKESLLLAKEKKEKELTSSTGKDIGKDKENEGRVSPKIKVKEKEKEKEKVIEKEKEKENEVRNHPKDKGNKNETAKMKEKINHKDKDKVQDKKGKGKVKDIVAAKEIAKEVEIDRKPIEQESGEKDDVSHVDAEAVKAILMSRKSSQVVVIHPPFGVLATLEKAVQGQPTYWDDAERNQKSAEPLGSQSFPTKPQRKTISISPKRRQSEHPISLRSSPQRHHSDGAMTTGSRSVAASPDTKDWTALRNSISPMSSSQITSAFRSESFDIPPGGFDVLPRGRADSSATMQSRSESLLMDEEQIIAPLDKEVYKEGFIYKKNSTGFFRNWKRVYFTITRRYMMWTSSVGLNSMYYDLRGATIVKTLQFRFQVMNLTAGGAGKSVHREFAAESHPDMDEWVTALQEAIDRANEHDAISKLTTMNGDSMGSLYQSLSELESVENPRYERSRNRSSTAPAPFLRDLNIFEALEGFKDLKINGAQDDSGRKDKKQYKSMRKSLYDSSVSVANWLDGLGLKQYEVTFTSNGLDTVEMVQQKGMRAETLDALGITTPMHRSLLQYFEPRTYSNDIEVEVTKSKDMGGLLIVYTVVTSWRSLRSALSLQYSDFKDFHLSLEKILKDHPVVLKSMPKLPDPKLFILSSKTPDVQGTVNNIPSVMAITSPLRHQVLQSYLRQLAVLLENSNFFNVLLAFLELTPPPSDQKIKV